ncbi:Gustatory receptor 20, partial [Frankliniella occidentalis]
ELSLPYPSPCRVVEFRRGWLALRDLTQGLVLMPLTQLCMMIFSQLMFTLNSYLGLVCVFDQRLA